MGVEALYVCYKKLIAQKLLAINQWSAVVIQSNLPNTKAKFPFTDKL